MLAMLLNDYPELMYVIKKKLLYFVAKAEKKYNADPGDYWYRFWRADDPSIAKTADVYYGTFGNGVEDHLLGDGILDAGFTVKAGNCFASFGWYLDFDPGDGGYLLIKKQNVVKSSLPARKVYEQKNPKHLYLDFDHVIYSEQQELVDYICYNDFGADQIGLAMPFMFRIATKASLNLE